VLHRPVESAAESGHSHLVEWGRQNGLTIGRQSLGDRLVMSVTKAPSEGVRHSVADGTR
jgi:hypothetical protein